MAEWNSRDGEIGGSCNTKREDSREPTRKKEQKSTFTKSSSSRVRETSSGKKNKEKEVPKKFKASKTGRERVGGGKYRGGGKNG